MSTHVIKMPDIGEGIAEVELVAWHVKPGPGLVSQRGHGIRPSVGPVR